MNRHYLAGLLSSALALAAAGSLASISGCGHSLVLSQTHVGRQELYKTGNQSYDEFFEGVYDLQESTKTAQDDERKARVPLGQALGVGEASLDRMLDLVKTKADDLAQSKNRVHFAVEGVDEQG